ncbi:MAG: DUF5615 family PIN-like protein [Nostoc sp.]|uniref:DUF5615 family PIN-like protein n=1 Tax=Nostoc sp. TaxID=1180 RepID=UPI002FF60AB9
MKLLFDENLSPNLPNRLSDLFPNSLHVRDLGMKATIDPIVWDFSKNDANSSLDYWDLDKKQPKKNLKSIYRKTLTSFCLVS